jgi:hypothetical protein
MFEKPIRRNQMAKTPKGKKMTKTGKYTLETTKGKKRKFTGTLLKTINVTKTSRIAIFSVPKGF